MKHKIMACVALLTVAAMLMTLTGCSGKKQENYNEVDTQGQIQYVDLTYTTQYESNDSNEETATVPWGAALFGHDPEKLNWDLLLLAAGLTACVTDGGDKDPHFSEGHYISGALEKLDFQDIALFSYPKSPYNISPEDSGFGSKDNDYAFAVGHRVMEDENGKFDLVTAIMRGTVTTHEVIADSLYTLKHRDWVAGYTTYDGFYGFADDVLKGIDYVEDHYSSSFSTGRTVYLISGHSLGGAAANLVAAKLTNDGKTVYGFSFGALNSLTSSANSKFTNIWNCMNYYDAFGPNGTQFIKPANGSITFYNKYGNVGVNSTKYSYRDGDEAFDNHDMKPYYQGAKDKLFDFHTKKEPVTEAPTEYIPDEDSRDDDWDSGWWLVDDWTTSDGVELSFYDDGYFTMDWGFIYDEGEWYAEPISSDVMYIEMDGSTILTLMSTVYSAADEDYHFEILRCNDDNFYLVQVYGDYTARTSPCKLGFTRIGAQSDFSL